MTDHSNDPDRLSASEAARAIREGRLTVVELAEACLARCSSRPEVVAWAHLDAGLVRKEARRLDAVPMSQRTSPLFGVPIGIKDIFATKGGCPLDLRDEVLILWLKICQQSTGQSGMKAIKSGKTQESSSYSEPKAV